MLILSKEEHNFADKNVNNLGDKFKKCLDETAANLV